MRNKQSTPQNDRPPMKKAKASVILSIISAIFLALTAV